MPAANTCPEASDFQRLLHGELPASDVERLSEHLGGCPSCAAAVQTLLGQDTLLSAVRGAAVDALASQEVPAELTGRLLALRLRSDASPTLETLPPPQGPDEIARLAHYRVLKVLGQGGMGVVFLAEDTRLKRTVALKTMRPEVAADPQHRQRFLREARAAAKVEDDHIAPIYDVGEERGVPWLAMPFLKGESLDALLKRVKVLKPADAARLGAQVARGLAAAHAAGLIHRDIKPANIWVEPVGGGRARLLDFGLARDQSPERDRGDASLTRTGALIGTPAFMAPEQAEGQPLDARADLFSLGCVLYRAVTGRLPFQGDGILGTLAALATDTPPAPCEVDPEVPQPLSALIMSLLAKDPSARPASAAAVAAALDAIPEKPASPVPTALPVAPRRRWRLATAAALLLALGGALAAGIVIIIKNKDGKELARVTLPEGVSAEIKQDGDSGKAKVDSVQLDPDRRAAEWVLSIGGTIKIRLEGQEREIRAAKDLPVAPFEVAFVSLRDNQKVDDAQLEHFKGLTSLRWLELTDTGVSDAGLEHLKGLTNLTVLWLNNTRVSDAGLVHLKGLTSLIHLELGGTRVSDAGLVHLKGLTNLTALWLGNSQVGDAGLVHLKGLTSLTHLELGGTRVSDSGLVHLKGLTNLTELHLWNTRVSDAGLVHLKGLTNLMGLALGGTRVSDAGLEHLKGLTNLTFLWLGDTRVSDAGWVHLKGLTSLRSLELGGTQVSDAGLVHLKGLTNLRAILLSNTQVSDAGLEQLKGLTQLTDLHLWNTRVSDAGLEQLKGLTNLTALNLGSTRVGDAGLEHLKGLTKLTVLNLHGTRVSDAGLKLLAGLGSLKELHLTGTQATADGVAALQKALPKCKIVSGPG
jgi:serine/threonine protein kinase/Leucine-rich repeat (LRR) protein